MFRLLSVCPFDCAAAPKHRWRRARAGGRLAIVHAAARAGQVSQRRLACARRDPRRRARQARVVPECGRLQARFQVRPGGVLCAAAVEAG
eukprot:scaffold83_cov286-Prasinococcus_capsulatus_cf.AAC.3